MIQSDQRRALISPKGIGLRGPVYLVRSSRIGVEVVFCRLMVGDCVGECVRHKETDGSLFRVWAATPSVEKVGGLNVQ